MIVLTIIIWIVLALVVSSLASTKGRSSFGFFVLSAIFSPIIALLILLVLGNDNNSIEKNDLKNCNLIKCPNCAETIKSEALVCKHCSNKVEVKEKKFSATGNNNQYTETSTKKNEDELSKPKPSRSPTEQTIIDMITYSTVILIITSIGIWVYNTSHKTLLGDNLRDYVSSKSVNRSISYESYDVLPNEDKEILDAIIISDTPKTGSITSRHDFKLHSNSDFFTSYHNGFKIKLPLETFAYANNKMVGLAKFNEDIFNYDSKDYPWTERWSSPKNKIIEKVLSNGEVAKYYEKLSFSWIPNEDKKYIKNDVYYLALADATSKLLPIIKILEKRVAYGNEKLFEYVTEINSSHQNDKDRFINIAIFLFLFLIGRGIYKIRSFSRINDNQKSKIDIN